jgi:hypothetical protein
MLGRVGRLARDARVWLRDESELRAAHGPSDTAYPEINALFVRIVRETDARPEYLWGSLHGGHLAKALGIEEISLIEFGGERLAISEFNERNSFRKISSFHGLRHYVPSRCVGDLWVEKMHLAHVLDHPFHGKPDGLLRVARKDLP